MNFYLLISAHFIFPVPKYLSLCISSFSSSSISLPMYLFIFLFINISPNVFLRFAMTHRLYMTSKLEDYGCYCLLQQQVRKVSIHNSEEQKFLTAIKLGRFNFLLHRFRFFCGNSVLITTCSRLFTSRYYCHSSFFLCRLYVSLAISLFLLIFIMILQFFLLGTFYSLSHLCISPSLSSALQV